MDNVPKITTCNLDDGLSVELEWSEYVEVVVVTQVGDGGRLGDGLVDANNLKTMENVRKITTCNLDDGLSVELEWSEYVEVVVVTQVGDGGRLGDGLVD